MKWKLGLFAVWVCLILIAPRTYITRPQSTVSNYPKAITEKPDLSITPPISELEFTKFAIDDTEILSQLRHQVSCLPSSWGYSIEEGKHIFPEFEYPHCNRTFDGVKGTLELNFTSETVELKCSGNYKGKLALPKQPSKLVHNKGNQFIEIENTGKPIQLKGFEEYALATCEEDSPYEIVKMKPRINQTLHENARNLMLEGEPIRILHIVVDSFSRRHLFRKLPKTVQVLNKLKMNSDYEVYDFKLHNIAGAGSPENQVWIFSGRNRMSRQHKSSDFPNDIWNLLRPYGYISLLGFENCNEGFAPALGENITVDHAVNEFYCAASKYTDYSAGKYNALQQRCIGPHMSHHYLMEYAMEFMDGYKHANQWTYLHMNAAHEASGQHAQAIDLDLAEFLESVLKRYNNTFIFLEADHGMRYGEWWSSEEASVEYRLPALFFLTPTSLLKKYPKASWALTHNSIRLTSKLDLRKTMLQIAEVPYSQAKKEVNLLTQRINDSRTCEDIAVSDWLCSCTQFDEFNSDVYLGTQASPLRNLLEQLAKDGIAEIGTGLMSSRGALFHCESLTLDKITYAAGKVSSKTKEMIKFQISVKESALMKFELNYLIYSEDAFVSQETTALKPIYYLGKKQYRLLFVNRLDKYEGDCEERAKSFNIAAKFCLCKADS